MNAVRAYPPDASRTTQPGARARLLVPYAVRPNFVGGPHDGTPVPNATIAANFATWKANEISNGAWVNVAYNPLTAAANGTGDRITIARALLAVQKRTITVGGIGDGAAGIDNTGTAVAGNPIVWEVLATVTSPNASPGPVDDVTIIDSLPPYVSYDAGCTATIAGGTPADLVQYGKRWNAATGAFVNDPGYTSLTWNLGTRQPNTAIQLAKARGARAASVIRTPDTPRCSAAIANSAPVVPQAGLPFTASL